MCVCVCVHAGPKRGMSKACACPQCRDDGGSLWHPCLMGIQGTLCSLFACLHDCLLQGSEHSEAVMVHKCTSPGPITSQEVRLLGRVQWWCATLLVCARAPSVCRTNSPSTRTWALAIACCRACVLHHLGSCFLPSYLDVPRALVYRALPQMCCTVAGPAC